MIFRDRTDAGMQLAAAVKNAVQLQQGEVPVVIALPRGGVPVAEEVAKAFDNAPLDVLIVRKIGAPIMPEYGIGAMAEGGFCYINSRAAYEVLTNTVCID